ncbi:MAG: hypothetical protein RLZZ292_3176 [Bacteroidota bacterium]|jgi:hypothetical protein
MKNVFQKSKLVFLLFLCIRCGQKNEPPNVSLPSSDTIISINPTKPITVFIDKDLPCPKCSLIQRIVLNNTNSFDTIALYRNPLDSVRHTMDIKYPYYIKIKHQYYKVISPSLGMCGLFQIKPVKPASIIGKSNSVDFLLAYSCRDYFLYYHFEKKGKQFFLTNLYSITNKDDVTIEISKTPNDITDLVEITKLNIPINQINSDVANYIDIHPTKSLHFKRKDSLAIRKWFDAVR